MKKEIKAYTPLIFFGVITIIGVILNYSGNILLWELYGTLDTASAVALALLAFLGYLEYIKFEDIIKIYFQVDNQKTIDTKLSLLRKECTRSEIFGILGMIQKDSKGRYDIQYMKDIKLLTKLQNIQKGNLDELIIPLNESELKQFKYEEQEK